MDSLVSAASFDMALRILAIVGPIIGVTLWLVGRRNNTDRNKVIWGISIGVVPVTVYTLWLVERLSIRVFGLDSVLGLGIMVVVFLAVGVVSAALITTISRRGN
jgi:hypothetical protein